MITEGGGRMIFRLLLSRHSIDDIESLRVMGDSIDNLRQVGGGGW